MHYSLSDNKKSDHIIQAYIERHIQISFELIHNLTLELVDDFHIFYLEHDLLVV